MSYPFAGLLVVTAVVFAFGPAGAADPPKDLLRLADKDKVKAYRDEVERAAEFGDRLANKRVVLAAMVGYKRKVDDKADAAASEVVETLHYDYDRGKTVRTVYDLTAKKVVKSDLLEAHPTPLAVDEVTAAKQLAQEKDAKVAALLAKHGADQVTVSTLAPVVSDKKHPNYGKRLAVLIYSPAGKLTESRRVTVNLSDKSVVPD